MEDPNIKPTDLTLAGELLPAFVEEYKDLYGEGAIVYNVHALFTGTEDYGEKRRQCYGTTHK